MIFFIFLLQCFGIWEIGMSLIAMGREGLIQSALNDIFAGWLNFSMLDKTDSSHTRHLGENIMICKEQKLSRPFPLNCHKQKWSEMPPPPTNSSSSMIQLKINQALLTILESEQGKEFGVKFKWKFLAFQPQLNHVSASYQACKTLTKTDMNKSAQISNRQKCNSTNHSQFSEELTYFPIPRKHEWYPVWKNAQNPVQTLSSHLTKSQQLLSFSENMEPCSAECMPISGHRDWVLVQHISLYVLTL